MGEFEFDFTIPDPNNPTKDSSDNQWTPSNSGTLPTYRAP
jgi:hypothetical protein